MSVQAHQYSQIFISRYDSTCPGSLFEVSKGLVSTTLLVVTHQLMTEVATRTRTFRIRYSDETFESRFVEPDGRTILRTPSRSRRL